MSKTTQFCVDMTEQFRPRYYGPFDREQGLAFLEQQKARIEAARARLKNDAEFNTSDEEFDYLIDGHPVLRRCLRRLPSEAAFRVDLAGIESAVIHYDLGEDDFESTSDDEYTMTLRKDADSAALEKALLALADEYFETHFYTPGEQVAPVPLPTAAELVRALNFEAHTDG